VQGALGTRTAIDAAGAWWWVGEDAQAAGAPLTMIGQDRLRDPAIIPALLRGALDRLGAATGSAPDPGVCVTGLPAVWAQDKALAGLLGARLRDATGAYTSIRVIAEPLGAMYAALLDDHGAIVGDTALQEGRIGVIDLGHHTVDLAVLHRGLPVPSTLETWQLGTAGALRQIRARLGALSERELSLHETDLAVRSETLTVRGRPRPLPASWDAPLVEQGRTLVSRLAEAWGAAADLDAILVAGGGAAETRLAAPILEAYPHAWVIDRPQTAIARGYARLARRLALAQQAHAAQRRVA
jgi:putative intracellular protease/amidase